MLKFNIWQKVLIILGIFILFLVISSLVVPLLQKIIDAGTRSGLLTLSVIQSFLLFIFPAFISARIISRRPMELLGLTKAPGLLPILGVVFAYLIALPALNQLIYWNEHFIFPENFSELGESLRHMEEKAQDTSTTMLAISDFWGMIVNLLVIGILTAFGEELFFRGALQRSLASSGKNHLAIWLTAFIFSFMHLQFFGFVPRLILGAWFGYLLYWTQSIYVPIIAHFINNGVVVVCAWLTINGYGFEFDRFGVTEEGFPTAAFISLIATIAFLIFFRRTFFNTGNSFKELGYANL